LFEVKIKNKPNIFFPKSFSDELERGAGEVGCGKTPAKTLLETVFEIMYDAKFEGESESEVGI
jgi:hypothetical protein